MQYGEMSGTCIKGEPGVLLAHSCKRVCLWWMYSFRLQVTRIYQEL